MASFSCPGLIFFYEQLGYGRIRYLFVECSYLRVKNIQIGYTLPKALTQKFGVQKLRVSVNTENPLTFTKNSFIDPESSEFGSDMGGIGGIGANSGRNYPTLTYYGFGLDIEF